MSAHLLPLALAVPVGLAVGIGFLLWLVHRQHRQRREALKAWATDNGWAFMAHDVGRPSMYGRFEPFRSGGGDHCKHVITGRLPRGAFQLMEFHVATEGGMSWNRTRTFRVCSLQMPRHVERFTIEPERARHKMREMLAPVDIDFESQAFSDRFWVRCSDRRFAYDVIDARMMRFLLAHPQRTWQWRGDTLVLFDPGHLKRPEADALLHVGDTFRSHLPRHVVAVQP